MLATLRLMNLALAVILLCPSLVESQVGTESGSRAVVIRHIRIYESPSEYCAWPSIARTSGGDLIVLFTKTEEHLGPDGAILLSRSTNNGKTWLRPTTVLDSPIDDRESGITTLRDGRIVGHFWSTFWTKESYVNLARNSYGRDLLDRWIAMVGREEYRAERKNSGGSTAISSDGGRTWSNLREGHDSVHGGIELASGGLLLASYRESPDSIIVHTADSASGPWRRLAAIVSPHPESLSFGEPHMLQLKTGRVIMMIRATARPYNDRDPRCVLWESYSDDNGKTWAAPFATPLWGFPPHLALLSDGRVLCTYGYRRPPYGQRACVSDDGVNWSLRDEVILRDDAPNSDLGYPASIELDRGVILTVYYQPNVPLGTIQKMDPPDPRRTKPGILGTIWKVPPRKEF
ncbi:MAG: sialidase family protein [Ignavibacteriales bacterium]|nr:sialidase family protein [Ignavibacteriales bacterium]